MRDLYSRVAKLLWHPVFETDIWDPASTGLLSLTGGTGCHLLPEIALDAGDNRSSTESPDCNSWWAG
jgi:hypothetical protein